MVARRGHGQVVGLVPFHRKVPVTLHDLDPKVPLVLVGAHSNRGRAKHALRFNVRAIRTIIEEANEILLDGAWLQGRREVDGFGLGPLLRLAWSHRSARLALCLGLGLRWGVRCGLRRGLWRGRGLALGLCFRLRLRCRLLCRLLALLGSRARGGCRAGAR